MEKAVAYIQDANFRTQLKLNIFPGEGENLLKKRAHIFMTLAMPKLYSIHQASV